MGNLPIYQVVLGESKGLAKMSLVESPAVGVDFLKFTEEKPLNFSIDEDKHIVFGCALRADYLIYRRDNKLGEYYVNFTKDAIDNLYQEFLTTNKFNDVNLNHEQDTNGVHLIQSFIKDKSKGIDPVGFEEVADGSWFCAYKIDNEDVWNEVKEGKFKGFSVEGIFQLEQTTDDIDSLIDELMN